MTDTDPSYRAERSQPGAGPLSGIRVLDISGGLGAYCSKLLADLGADVLKVERPGGDDLRRTPPFIGQSGHGGQPQSLIFLSYHSNKRGITLDVGRSESLPVLEALGRTADVIVASPTRRGPVTGFDRDAPALAWAEPDAIVASITPFGLTGPMRDLRMTPFLSFAMGGGMHWVGESDGPPLAVPGQLQWDEAGIHAAAGIVAALSARDRDGGQVLDLSVHEVAAAKDFLLREGTDMKYGARHLKRAVERNLVHPMSNLIATGQVRGGDLLRIDFQNDIDGLSFFKDAEDMPTHVMAQMVDVEVAPVADVYTAGAMVEPAKASAKTTKR